MSLRIVDVVGSASVQDLGRTGRAHEGVPPSGAADTLSLRLANLVVGNAPGTAGIELAMGALTIEAAAPLAIATGSGPHAFEAIALESGDRFTIAPDAGLARAYLAVAGGVDVPVVLGARATLAGAQLGGHEGRSLRAGDTLPVCAAAGQPRRVPASLRAMVGLAVRQRVLRIIVDGAEAEAPRGLLRVSPRSDRVGVRLVVAVGGRTPERLAHSRGVVPGTMQMPSPTELVILGPDGPTTGGYPTIGTVIAADLPAVGQLCAGQWVRLEAATRDEALDALRARRDAMDRLD